MNQENLTRFIQLFTLADAEASQRIAERLSLVLRDPAAYQMQYAEELAERGIETKLPAQELRDVALIDALLNEELLWEADWTDPAADLVYGLNETLAQQGRAARLEEPVAGRHATTGPEALDIVQDLLEALGLALVLLTLDSDAHALSVVAEAQVEELRALASELGFGLKVY
jgi:prephenate dehydratase